jgi:hypothetical protein
MFIKIDGKDCIDFRYWYMADDGNWKPAEEGITFEAELLYELIGSCAGPEPLEWLEVSKLSDTDIKVEINQKSFIIQRPVNNWKTFK